MQSIDRSVPYRHTNPRQTLERYHQEERDRQARLPELIARYAPFVVIDPRGRRYGERAKLVNC